MSDAPPPRWAAPVLAFLFVLCVLGMVAIRTRPKTGRLRIEVPGAFLKLEIFVDGVKECETSPCLVPDLLPGEHHIKVLSADAVPADESAIVERGEETSVTLDLSPMLAAAPPMTPTEPEPVPVPAEEPTTPGVAVGTVDEPPEAPVAGNGTLNLNSIPPASVMLDGKLLGKTPKIGLSVPAGKHLVAFLHPQAGTKIVSVVVNADETKTVAIKLE